MACAAIMRENFINIKEQVACLEGGSLIYPIHATHCIKLLTYNQLQVS